MGRRYRYASSSSLFSILILMAIACLVGFLKFLIDLIIEHINEILSALIIILFVVFVVVSFIISIAVINKKYAKFIKSYSIAYNSLLKINQKYEFFNIPNYNLGCSYDNENIFYDISTKDYLTSQLLYKIKEIKNAIYNTNENKKLYNEYLKEINDIISFGNYTTSKLPIFKKLLAKRERMLFDSAKLSPTIEFNIEVKLNLTNINRIYRGCKNKVFNTEEILEIIDGLLDRKGDYYNNPEIWNSICKVERGKVTNRIRFLVYKRDNNRCVKCGSRYNLEVDHIFPISKGGKSTLDNLQTLCHDCNQMKSNIIEEGTVNPREVKRQTGEFCPLCGAKLVIRNSKNGMFVGCSSFPNCKYTKAIKK